MTRDWHKLRRQWKAQEEQAYSPIESWHPPLRTRSQRRRYFRKRGRVTPPPQPAPRKQPSPTLERIARIQTPAGIVLARFARLHGRWRCTAADPQIEWFTRVHDMNTIDAWLRTTHYPISWPEATPARTSKNPRAEESPAEAYPPFKASPSPEVNTGPSLNTNAMRSPEHSLSRLPHSLQQSGVNTPPCLIASGCPEENTTGA